MARKLPTGERSAAIVDAIITAVERILEAEGPAGLSTNRVAEIAGVSVGTLYQYYSNKEALIGALNQRYVQQVLGFVRAALAALGDTPFAIAAERIAESLLQAHTTLRPINRWLFELRTAAGVQEIVRAELDHFVDDLTAFFDARTDFRFTDSRAAAFMLVHSVDGIFNATSARSGIDVRALAREWTDMLVAYVASRATESPRSG